MSEATTKTCVICNQDVSASKRVKDARGRYYCARCHASATKQQSQDSLASRLANTVDESNPQYPCNACKQTFGVDDVFDDDGKIICKDCWAKRDSQKSKRPKPAPRNTCRQCGEALAHESAFCPRCGNADEGGVGLDDQVDLSTIVGWMSMYAEAAAKTKTIVEMSQTLERAAEHGVQVDQHELQRITPIAEREAKDADRVVEQSSTNLRKFDRERLIGVRDVILKNPNVPDSAKAGLRFDPAGLFGPSGMPSVPHKPVAATSSLSGGYGKLGRSQSRVGSSGYQKPPKGSTPIGFGICIGICVLGVLLLIVVMLELASEKKLTSLAVTCGLCAVGCFVIGGVGGANACPKCFKLFTAEVIDSELLGSHWETRKEQRVARHSEPYGGKIHGETRYEADVPVHVQTHLETYRCAKCNHVWQKKSRSES